MSKSQYANWYSDRRWRAKRAAHLARHPTCVMCEARGIVRLADVVDHIEPHRGDRHSFWYGALQSLCHQCHSGDKQALEAGRQPKGCDDEGWPR